MASHSKERRKFTAIDLFAGCGGLTTGLVQAGFNVVAAIEVNSGAAEAYRLNHPRVRLLQEDIRRVTSSRLLGEIKLARGQLDALAGCPPCQGFSRLRTLNGTRGVDDSRNDLLFEYLRLVRGLKPKTLMFENVPGLVTDPRYRQVLDELRALGYATVEAVHDAADYGVPQRRKRLLILGSRRGSIQMPAPALERVSVRQAIEALPPPGGTGDPVHDVVERRTSDVQGLIRLIRHDGGSRRDLGPQLMLACHTRCDGFYDVYGRMWWDDVAPTITSGFVNPSKGRFLHPQQDRCVTPREAAILQTFPRDYRFPMMQGKYAVAEMIGNALPPELARRHALALAAALA